MHAERTMAVICHKTISIKIKRNTAMIKMQKKGERKNLQVEYSLDITSQFFHLWLCLFLRKSECCECEPQTSFSLFLND